MYFSQGMTTPVRKGKKRGVGMFFDDVNHDPRTKIKLSRKQRAKSLL